MRQPAPPFITSTLQQEAWYKLRYSAETDNDASAAALMKVLPIGKGGKRWLNYLHAYGLDKRRPQRRDRNAGIHR